MSIHARPAETARGRALVWVWSRGERRGRQLHAAGGFGVAWLGPAGTHGGVGAGHVVAGGLHLLPVGVGLFVDDLEVAAQRGDELLAGRRSRAAPKVAGGKHIADDGLVFGLQRGSLGADQRAVGVDIAELVVDRHGGS